MLQNNALSHLEKRGVSAPRLIVRNSVAVFSIPDRIHSGHCCVRMLSWVKGRVFGDFQPQSLQLMESLGRLLATVDNVCGSFFTRYDSLMVVLMIRPSKISSNHALIDLNSYGRCKMHDCCGE